MSPVITAVETSCDLPSATTVVVIGGGIVGLTAALTLAERGIPVVVIEKGRIAGEQSSRNLGWIRKMGRERKDLPLALAAETLWQGMAERVGADVGYRQDGILYAARTQAEMVGHQRWLESIADFGLDSRLVTPTEMNVLAPGSTGGWAGGIYTASDGRAEPTLASSAIARQAIAKGAVVVEQCAVRTLLLVGGRVQGVMTERGEVRCDQVILAAGLWSRRFLGNLGVSLPTLPLVASVLRTAPMEGPTDIAVGAPDFSFRRNLDGGYIITQRGAFLAPIVPDSIRLGHRYLSMLRAQWKHVRIRMGRDFVREMSLARRWTATATSPFEQMRTMNPPVDQGLNEEALRNLTKAWPMFENARIDLAWAGMIDVTPDSLPVISPVEELDGLTLATGFSGHGFGTSPAAAQLAVDIALGDTPIVDPSPYRLKRLSRP